MTEPITTVAIDTTKRTRSTISPWYDDGNIVLQAENTLFRVHRSVLSHHSSVFRDMFSLPPSADDKTGEMVEGCVVVRLYDKAEDVGYMLSALYCSSPPFSDGELARREKIRLPIVAGILRLGTKYLISHLRKIAIEALTAAYPTTLDAFDKAVDLRDSEQTSEYINSGAVVQLLSDQHVLSALPAAFYQLCGLSFKTLLNCSQLSIENQRIAIGAKEDLISAHVSMISNELGGNDRRCHTTEACEAAMYKFRAEFYGASFGQALMKAAFLWDLPIFGLCNGCLSKCLRKYGEARERLWDRLPSIFDLPGWDDLRSMDSASY